MSTNAHELVMLFQQHVHPLSNKLVDMLNEHYQHQTERRGCGYTQASRFLADYINSPRHAQDFSDLKIFQNFETKTLKKVVDHLELEDWHNLDQNQKVLAYLEQHPNDEDVLSQLQWQRQLRQLINQAQLEESRIMCQLIIDIILPTQRPDLVQIPTLLDKPKVGSCPMAEKFFLKVAHKSMLRHGEINIFVDEQQQPILLEKLNMGDDHSCISLAPIMMNGVVIPAGCLFSVDYQRDQISNKIANREFKGYVIPYQDIQGFWFLRVTTLAISPENRKRAFTTHFQQQVINGLYSPEKTQLSQLFEVAQSQIG